MRAKCGIFILKSVKLLLVTGGYNGVAFLDSTEILTMEAGAKWRAGAKLPSWNFGLRAVTIDNRVLTFGIDSSTFFVQMIII